MRPTGAPMNGTGVRLVQVMFAPSHSQTALLRGSRVLGLPGGG